MAERKAQNPSRRVPSGFTSGSGRRASEYAREQGWQTNEEERTRTPLQKQPIDGGTDYDYGARDFGDLPADTGSVKPMPRAIQASPQAGRSGQHAGRKAPTRSHGTRAERKKKPA